MMGALADTEIWYPILIAFVRDHILSVPPVKKAMGALNMDVHLLTEPLEIPSLDLLKEQTLFIIESAHEEACEQATNAAAEAADNTIAKV